MYFGCHVSEGGKGGNPVCNESGDWSRVSMGAVMVAIAHWYYIFDYNWNESQPTSPPQTSVTTSSLGC